MARKKRAKQIRQILGNGKENILTVKNGIVIGKKSVRKRKKLGKKLVNIFDPMTKVKMDFG